MRPKRALAYEKCCYYCEKGKINEDGDGVFCERKKANMSPNGICRAFFYDLVRRVPELPKLPEIELPILD